MLTNKLDFTCPIKSKGALNIDLQYNNMRGKTGRIIETIALNFLNFNFS